MMEKKTISCKPVNQVTYDEAFQGKKDFEIDGVPVVYHCKSEDKTTKKETETETKTETETEKSISASSNLALSLLILIFLGI